MRASHLYPSSASVRVFDQTKGREVVIGGCLRKQYLQFLHEPASDPGWYVESVGPAEIGNH